MVGHFAKKDAQKKQHKWEQMRLLTTRGDP